MNCKPPSIAWPKLEFLAISPIALNSPSAWRNFDGALWSSMPKPQFGRLEQTVAPHDCPKTVQSQNCRSARAARRGGRALPSELP